MTLPDGTIRIVVAAEDPAIPHSNWLDTAGHAFGTDCFRWITCAPNPLALRLCATAINGLAQGQAERGRGDDGGRGCARAALPTLREHCGAAGALRPMILKNCSSTR